MNNAPAPKKVHKPLLHVSKRKSVTTLYSVSTHAIGIFAALVFCALLISLLTDVNPFRIYTEMFKGTFGSEIRRMEVLNETAMLLCVALALTPAFKMKFWNIGAEGQVLMGGFAAAFCMREYGLRVKESTLFVMMIVSAIIVGMLWAAIPAIFKAFFNTNETLFTLMMNYVATTIVSYYIFVEDRSGRQDLGIINERTGNQGYFPKIGGENYVLNIIIVAVVLILMFVYLKYTKHGYEISVVGESQNTAKYIGINVKSVIIRTVAISGAICGLVGLMLVAGSPRPSINTSLTGGIGFTAILVSWIGKLNPIIMVFVSTLIVLLTEGSSAAADTFKLDASIGGVLTAIIIFFIIACEFFTRYKVELRLNGGAKHDI